MGGAWIFPRALLHHVHKSMSPSDYSNQQPEALASTVLFIYLGMSNLFFFFSFLLLVFSFFFSNSMRYCCTFF